MTERGAQGERGEPGEPGEGTTGGAGGAGGRGGAGQRTGGPGGTGGIGGVAHGDRLPVEITRIADPEAVKVGKFVLWLLAYFAFVMTLAAIFTAIQVF